MLDPSSLEALALRVESGSGRDRELDGLVAAAMLPPQRNGWKPWACAGGYVLTESGEKPRPGMGQFMPAPRYTTSLDAVKALIEAKLPGCGFSLDMASDRERHGAAARISQSKRHWTYAGFPAGYAPTPERALLAASLRALAQKEEG